MFQIEISTLLSFIETILDLLENLYEALLQHRRLIYIDKMEDLRCPQCKKQYTLKNPPRLLTMCGHTYCHTCIKSLIKRKDYRYNISCPEDRLSMNVDSNTPSHFPKNMIILEAIQRSKQKDQSSDEKNEFLINNSNESIRESGGQSKNSILTMKSNFFSSRKISLQQGMCLLHNKPLDIICMQQKKHICAQCALFGLHKGHSFTTIKQLHQKRSEWISKVSEIIQEKKNLQHKLMGDELKRQISLLIQKKKQLLLLQLQNHTKKIIDKIKEDERTLQTRIEDKMKTLIMQLQFGLEVGVKYEQSFQIWSSNVQQKSAHLQNEDIDGISLFSQQFLKPQQNLVVQGKQIIQNIKNQAFSFWSNIQKIIQYPKFSFSPDIQDKIGNSVKLLLSDEDLLKKQSNSYTFDLTLPDDYSKHVINDDPILDQISLLDMSGGGFKFQHSELVIHEPSSSVSISIDAFGQQNKSLGKSQIFSKQLKKNKSLESAMTTYCINNNQSQNTISFKKPQKERMLTETMSKSNLGSPSKNKLKKPILKMKQPAKFQKIMNNLQIDNLDNIDFTGFQLGDQITKEVCLKIVNCHKPKMLRLMKNQLTDECSKQVVDTLNVIDFLNLAQNNFTDRIIDVILQKLKTGSIKKGKNIHLGQNKVNAKRFKQKMNELKRLGITITL